MVTGRNESVGAEAIEPITTPSKGVEEGTPPVEVPKAEKTGFEVKKLAKKKWEIIVDGKPIGGTFTSKKRALKYAREMLGLKPAEKSEVIEEPKPDTGEAKKGIPDWAPLEDAKVMHQLDVVATTLLDIPGVSMYHAENAKYWCWSCGKNKAVANLRTSKSSGRLGVATLVNGKRLMLRYAITKDGIFDGDKQLSLKELVKAVRKYIKDRSWT